MPHSPHDAPTVKSQSLIAMLLLTLMGFAFIVLGNIIDKKVWKIEVGEIVAHVGAVLLIVGVLQWLFDKHVRSTFFQEVREEMLGGTAAASSGICGFFRNSKTVDFSEYFTTSTKLVIGVNYSGKVIDQCIDLLRQRTAKKLETHVVTIRPDTHAQAFFAADYKAAHVQVGLNKIEEMVQQVDPGRKLVKIIRVDTMLRYTFVRFDSRIWVVVGTNGLGRRPVPGFFVSAGSPWFGHFLEDIELLLKR